MALTVSYLWSRGIQLYGIRDLNLPTTTTNFTYIIDDANGNQIGTYTTPVVTGSRPNSKYGTIAYDENGVNSYYNGLSVQLNKTFSHGFQAQLSWTWAHEIDDGQSYGQSANNLYLYTPNYWLNNGNYKADKGSGTLDQRHRIALSWVWTPTFTHRSGAFWKYAVNNWQLSSITTLASGVPYGSVTVKVNDKPVTGMFSTFSLNGTGFSSRAPFLPINSYYLPAMYQSNARVSKIVPIGASERYRLFLNLEVFNLGNNWSATGYSSSQAYIENKGVITPTFTGLYFPSGDAQPPDGTMARRLQLSARFDF